LVVGIVLGAVAVARRRIPWEVRRLGAAGFTIALVTVAGFLGSVMVMDAFSTRYLAAIVLSAPLALAPIAWTLRRHSLGVLLAPYLASAAVNGWMAYVPWVKGPEIVVTRDGTAADEHALEKELSARGVRWAMADYWVSYRLTFLYDERIVVVPKNAVEDRYAPYKDAFDRARTVAYIFDPLRSREASGSIESQLRARGVSFERGEWIQTGRLTALVVTRR
jgi:hypothetical protein